MTRIKGYGFNRGENLLINNKDFLKQFKGKKEDIFGEFETSNGKYFFKQSHSSKDSLYKVGIHFYDTSTHTIKKVYTISMPKDTIKGIKSGTSISKIDFFDEEGFINYIENTYVYKEFNQKNFSDFFSDHFSRAYAFMNNAIIEGGHTKDYLANYISYLVSLAPSNILENIYRSRPDAFRKTFRYTEYQITLTQDEKIKRNTNVLSFLDTVMAQIQQALNVYGIEYQSYEEFEESGNWQNFKAKPPKNKSKENE